MTIRKGEAWGAQGVLPRNGVVVHTDAQARAAVTSARRSATDLPTLGLVGGDLARTCGASGDEGRLHGPAAQILPVDLGEVLVDGALHFFVAHLVARRPWWRGRVIAAMNAQYLGRWDVAPRSHPNDGRLDLVDADLPLGDRLAARSRLPTGTHVPHPRISERRAKAVQLDLPAGMHVWLDGERLGPARALSIRCVPDALEVVV
ncbi:MAG: diacylglycerol/lipid kinase family protein [Acidimicrobiales bacterium]